MKIVARDKKGREYIKDVIVTDRTLWFGGYEEYTLSDEKHSILQGYPFKRDLCIDAEGSNHNGSPVYVTKEDMNRIFEEFIFKIKICTECDDIENCDHKITCLKNYFRRKQ